MLSDILVTMCGLPAFVLTNELIGDDQKSSKIK